MFNQKNLVQRITGKFGKEMNRTYFLNLLLLTSFLALNVNCESGVLENLLQTEENIIESLTEDNFDENINNGSPKQWIVSFMAPWCPHCVQFAPTYKEFGKMIYASSAYPNLKLGFVNCSTHSSLCTKMGVHAFPALFTFIDGFKYQYNMPGGRGVEDQTKFITDYSKDSNGVAIVKVNETKDEYKMPYIAISPDTKLPDTSTVFRQDVKNFKDKNPIMSIILSSIALLSVGSLMAYGMMYFFFGKKQYLL